MKEKTPKIRKEIANGLAIVRGSKLFETSENPITCPTCLGRIGKSDASGTPKRVLQGPMGCYGLDKEGCKIAELLRQLKSTSEANSDSD